MSEAGKFEVGDRVRLRSGGPLMVVHNTNGETAWCRWFNVNGDFCEKSDIKIVTLMDVEGISDVRAKR